jgi:hypothetical protein
LAEATIDPDETPDFLAILPDQTIGVELTEYHHGTASKASISQREREMFERKVVADAQHVFEAGGGPPLYVSVSFYGRVINERPGLLARAIAEAVADQLPDLPASDTYASIRVKNWDLPEILQSWVAFVMIMRTARNNVRLWTNALAGYIDADAEGISAVIADKEADIPFYRPCDEKRLLIYASGDSLASTMTPFPDATTHVYTTRFDRVYLLDTLGQVHRLRCSR